MNEKYNQTIQQYKSQTPNFSSFVDYVDKTDVNSQATSRPPDNHVIGWDNKKVNDWLTENDLTKYKAKWEEFIFSAVFAGRTKFGATVVYCVV